MGHVVLFAPFEDIGFASFWLFFRACGRSGLESSTVTPPPTTSPTPQSRSRKVDLWIPQKVLSGVFSPSITGTRAMRKRRRLIDHTHTHAHKARSPGSWLWTASHRVHEVLDALVPPRSNKKRERETYRCLAANETLCPHRQNQSHVASERLPRNPHTGVPSY